MMRQAKHTPIHALLLAAVLLLWLPALQAQPARVTITDPYIDLHTGPGRGFPVVDVIERGTEVELGKHQGDWYLLRGGNGRSGWVHREQLTDAVDAAGAPVVLRDFARDDYHRRRFELSAGGGVLDGDGAIIARAGYRLNPRFTLEAGLTHVPGTYSSSRLLSANLLVSPYPKLRVEPVLSAGIGYFENDARPTLVDGDDVEGADLNLGLGLRAYLARNLAVRADARRHRIELNSDRREHVTEFSVGIVVFF